MFLREPIVLFLSLLSGFSDALIFICIETFTLVSEQWGFDALQIGLCFIAVVIGYLVVNAQVQWNPSPPCGTVKTWGSQVSPSSAVEFSGSSTPELLSQI